MGISFDESIKGLYLNGEVKAVYLGDTKVYPTSDSMVFDTATVIYSFRKPSFTVEWTRAVIRLRRSNDNDQKYVFFDNEGKISLSSLIGVDSFTPSSTTLGQWVGSNDAYFNFFIGLTPDNTVDSSYTLGQGNTNLQPKFINSGVIYTVNGEPAIDFLSDTRYLESPAISAIDSGNTFTMFSVASNNESDGVGALVSTTDDVSNFRFDFLIDRRDVLRAYRFVNDSVTTNVDLLSQQDNSDVRLDVIVNVGKTATNYLNGVIQTDSLSWTGDYVNDTFRVGAGRQGSVPLDGTMQEIIIYSSDKTPDLSIINENINEYYNIY